MKNIVFLRSNPCNPDSRVQKEVIALKEAGYSVTILCWNRNSNHKEQVSDFMDSGITICRLGFKASFGEGMKNIIPFLKFQFAIRRWLKKHRNEYMYVHACDFDTAFFTYKLALRLKKIFVFDIFDFICGNPRNFLQWMVKKAQIRIINNAHSTIICTEEREKQIIGSIPKNLTVIHNTPLNATNTFTTRFFYLFSSLRNILLRPFGYGFGLEYEYYYPYFEEYIALANKFQLDTSEIINFTNPDTIIEKESISVIVGHFGLTGFIIYLYNILRIQSNINKKKFLANALLLFVFIESCITMHFYANILFIYTKIALNSFLRKREVTYDKCNYTGL